MKIRANDCTEKDCKRAISWPAERIAVSPNSEVSGFATTKKARAISMVLPWNSKKNIFGLQDCIASDLDEARTIGSVNTLPIITVQILIVDVTTEPEKLLEIIYIGVETELWESVVDKE